MHKNHANTWWLKLQSFLSLINLQSVQCTVGQIISDLQPLGWLQYLQWGWASSPPSLYSYNFWSIFPSVFVHNGGFKIVRLPAMQFRGLCEWIFLESKIFFDFISKSLQLCNTLYWPKVQLGWPWQYDWTTRYFEAAISVLVLEPVGLYISPLSMES